MNRLLETFQQLLKEQGFVVEPLLCNRTKPEDSYNLGWLRVVLEGNDLDLRVTLMPDMAFLNAGSMSACISFHDPAAPIGVDPSVPNMAREHLFYIAESPAVLEVLATVNDETRHSQASKALFAYWQEQLELVSAEVIRAAGLRLIQQLAP